MVKGNIFGLMGPHMKVILWKAVDMDKASGSQLKKEEISILVHMKTTKNVVTEDIFGQMVLYIRESLKMTQKVEKAS